MESSFSKVMVGLTVVFASSAVMFFAITYQMITEPIPIRDSSREVVTKNVPPGGNFIFRSGFNQLKKCRVTFYRTIFDSAGSRIYSDDEDRIEDAQKVGKQQGLRMIPIPESAAHGKAVYLSVGVWSCNFLQNLFPQKQELEPLYFYITENPK